MSIEKIKGAVSPDIARANRFEILGILPQLEVRAKAASVPQATIGKCEANYMGRVIPLAGDIVYPDWTVTVYQDTSGTVRRALYAWSQEINAHVANVGNAQAKRDGVVIQYGYDGGVVGTYQIKQCYPINIGEVTLASDSYDTPSEWTVTFAIEQWIAG